MKDHKNESPTDWMVRVATGVTIAVAAGLLVAGILIGIIIERIIC